MNLNKFHINPFENKWQKIEITKDLINTYHLLEWSKNFSLMTAGYRDQLDPNDAANPDVAFNMVTLSILGEAKARVFKQKLNKQGEIAHIHIGGETRPHTQEFISILARIYAAHNMKVHLRGRTQTTPLWYSSFGIFYNEFHSGENLTASHSPFFKGGWKPMDSSGKQLLAEEKNIISEVQNIVKKQVTINLAPWKSNDNIIHDFEIDEPYVKYIRSLIGNQAISDIKKAEKNEFKCAACPVGGSMQATSKHLFERLGISTGKDGIIHYFKGEEDPQYHQIGQIDGENFGPDPGKWQIYRGIGAQDILLNNEAKIVFLWDPDGDRFNIVTIASSKAEKEYTELGLEVQSYPDSNKSIVYFTPNQIYFMLLSHRISNLKTTNLFDRYNWFITSSISTSRMLDELASKENIPIVHVRVGFKYLGTFAEWIEKRSDPTELYITPTEDKVLLGKKPRALIMCEESGGATFGSTEFINNKSGSRGLITLREKDGMQFALMTLSLAAFLYNTNLSFADYYCKMISKYKIKYKYFIRSDIRLYNEGQTGVAREKAKLKGIVKRDQTMKFFQNLVEKLNKGKTVKDIGDEINTKLTNKTQKWPSPKNLYYIGDGTFLEYDTFWCLIRASGTDALLRYYIEGQDKKEIETFQKSIINLQI